MNQFSEDSFQKYQYWLLPLLYVIAAFLTFYVEDCWISIFIMFFGLPFIDKYFDTDDQNPTSEQSEILRKDKFYKYPLYASMLCDWIYQIITTYYFINNEIDLFHLIPFLMLNGMLSSTNMIAAHELHHKNTFFEQTVAKLTLIKNHYTHFLIEHNKGHHVNVGTDIDPSSAKYNQTVYQFFKQSISGAIVNSIALENQRLKQKNLSIINHDIYFYWMVQLFFYYFTYEIFGLKGALYFNGIGLIGILVQEIVNYIEHYGLQRKELSPGVYEKVTVMHSWNAPYRFSNAFTFKLQRHSDHHENSYKEYQALCSYKESPLLPQNYTILILLALYPTYWFKAINPMIQSYKKSGKLDKQVEQETSKIIDDFLQNCGFIITLMNIVSIMM